MKFFTAILQATTLVALCALISACAQPEATGGPPAAVSPTRTREQNQEIGRQHKTAEDLYKFFKDEAKGGKKLSLLNARIEARYFRKVVRKLGS